MKYRRTIPEIKLDLLKAVRLGYGAPSRIMRAANISWKATTKHLQTLIDEELVEMVDNPRRDSRTPKIYKITKKGAQLLKVRKLREG